MKKIIKNLPNISGLIILFIPLFFLNIGVVMQSSVEIFNRIIIFDNLTMSLLSLLVNILYIYVLVVFFVKFTRAFREKNSILYYFNHFIVYLAVACLISNLIATTIVYFNYYSTSKILILISSILNVVVIVLSLVCLFFLRKSKELFTISKDKKKNVLKLFTLNIVAALVSYVITIYIFMYLRPLSLAVLLSLIACILILPFYRFWPKIIDNKKYDSLITFLAAQIIVTNLVIYIISIFNIILTSFKAVSM